LFGKLRTRTGNFAFSPLSLSMALTMTWAGARGETAAQMRKVLHLDRTVEEIMGSTGKLIATFQDPALGVTVRLANRLFGEKVYTFHQSYLDSMKSTFGATLEAVDFISASELARERINAWGDDATEHHIKDIIPPGAVDEWTRLVLANAIYFLGDWRWPFAREGTRA